MENNEIKVKEIFQCGLIKLKCIKCDDGQHSCDGCFFCGKCFFFEITGYCSSINRKDKNNVIFIEVKE